MSEAQPEPVSESTPPPQDDAVAALRAQWAELKPRQFSLLRLAAQPTERGGSARPLRFAELGRLERHTKELSLLRLSVQLPGQMLHKETNVLEVWVEHGRRVVGFGPAAGLQVEPANRGLGRFLIAQAIDWARQHFGAYQVEPFALGMKGSLDEENRTRRDKLLEGLGFTVSYEDKLHMKGQVSAGLVSSLRVEWNREKLAQVSMLDAGQMLQNADQSLHEQAMKIRGLEERLTSRKREESALRFTISLLAVFSLFEAGLVFLLMIF